MSKSELVQFKVGKNDKLLYDSINSIKASGEQRGYLSDQIRQRLIVYEVLSKMIGENEPYTLLAKVSSQITGVDAPLNTQDKVNDVSEEKHTKENNDIADFVIGNNL